eukprot:2459836-Ditylum_brightwellii.AAC.1
MVLWHIQVLVWGMFIACPSTGNKRKSVERTQISLNIGWKGEAGGSVTHISAVLDTYPPPATSDDLISGLCTRALTFSMPQI